jgi:hypothetical protein
MTIVATVIGYIIIGIFALIIVTALWQWLLYGEIGNSISQSIKGNKIYINGKFIKETFGGNISMINGSVYENGKCIYKHKRKFRWQKDTDEKTK